jgi:DNA polymerase-3 subunit gamma/tau
MSDTLALKYRPTTFDDLTGQPAVQIILRQMIKVGQIPSALLFDGCRGTGKTTTARILAAALNCHEDTKPCGSCPSCKAVFDGSSMDVIEIDAASNGLVDDIRQLRQQVMYRHSGDWRVVILDEAHSMSAAAFNALLKTLEEPPPRTLFILLTTEPVKILPTVASRCMPFTFKRLSIDDITRRLAHIAHTEGYAVEHDLLQLLAERADGAMRDAVMLLDQVARIGLTTAEQYQRLIGHQDHAPAILERLVNGDLPGAFAKLDEALTRVADAATITADAISTLRDVLVLRCGGEVHKAGTTLAARQSLALVMETPTVLAALKVLWQLKTQMRTDDPRSSLELAVVMLSEVISTLSPPPAAPPKRMTLDDMGKLP